MGTKLQKFQQKIFGSSAGLNQMVRFGSLAAGAPVFTTDPADVQSLGNFLVGWYGATIGGAAPAKQDMNSLFFLITRQIAYLFQSGTPEWDNQTEYFIGSLVNVAGVLYVSKIDNNIGNSPATDAVNWRRHSGTPTGAGMDYFGPTAPAGFVFASGLTIGDPTSGATERANNDCYDLFALIWSGFTDGAYPIQNSDGTASTRGSSALADWSAHKRITIFDARDRARIGRGDMGGTAAGRITNAVNGIDTKVLGSSGGAEKVSLTAAQLPSHTHSGTTGVDYPDHNHGVYAASNDSGDGPSFSDGAANNNGQRGTTGAYNRHQHDFTTNGGDATTGAAHANVQPVLVANYIIKL